MAGALLATLPLLVAVLVELIAATVLVTVAQSLIWVSDLPGVLLPTLVILYTVSSAAGRRVAIARIVLTGVTAVGVRAAGDVTGRALPLIALTCTVAIVLGWTAAGSATWPRAGGGGGRAGACRARETMRSPPSGRTSPTNCTTAWGTPGGDRRAGRSRPRRRTPGRTHPGGRRCHRRRRPVADAAAPAASAKYGGDLPGRRRSHRR
ncbi:MAG: hypothetical protein R2705_09405 [Ilumatobacteraceae bacterium]